MLVLTPTTASKERNKHMMLAEIQWEAWHVIVIVAMVLTSIVVYDKGWPWQNRK